MTELIRQYWQQYLFGTLGHPTGLVVTLWLTAASVGLGFVLAVPLSVARASTNRWLSVPVSFYTYIIRGTPLYVQLLLLYSGVYTLDSCTGHAVPKCLFSGCVQLHDSGIYIEHRRLYYRDLCRGHQSNAAW